MIAFTRIPGNAFSFRIRETLRWSRGVPELYQEPKAGLFDYLGDAAPAAEARALDLAGRYRLSPLRELSTVSLYRKNLYLLDCLEKACEGLPPFAAGPGGLRALDVGSQDWHYVFGLERWLRHWQSAEGRDVRLLGIELDGYGIYADFHSRKDYAQAYAAQTGNPGLEYVAADFMKSPVSGCDVITIFYPFVTRYALLLWGLPLRFYTPRSLLAKAASATRPGGWLVVFCHTEEEHGRLLALGREEERYELVREGRALSNLVDFHEDVEDRRYSIWRLRNS